MRASGYAGVGAEELTTTRTIVGVLAPRANLPWQRLPQQHRDGELLRQCNRWEQQETFPKCCCHVHGSGLALLDSAKVRYTTACAGKFRICLSAASAAKILNPQERARLTAPSDIRLLPPESGTHTVALVTAPGEHAAELRRLWRGTAVEHWGCPHTGAGSVVLLQPGAALRHRACADGCLGRLASAYLALKVLERPLRADTRLTYGTASGGGAGGVGQWDCSFWGCADGIAWEAVERLLQPRPVVVVPMLVTAAIGFVGNLVSALFLRHGASLSTRAAYLHVLGGPALLGCGAQWRALDAVERSDVD
jgi:hypothetical protein